MDYLLNVASDEYLSDGRVCECVSLNARGLTFILFQYKYLGKIVRG